MFNALSGKTIRFWWIQYISCIVNRQTYGLFSFSTEDYGSSCSRIREPSPCLFILQSDSTFSLRPAQFPAILQLETPVTEHSSEESYSIVSKC